MNAISRDIETLYRDRYAVFVRTLAGVTRDWESARDAVQDGFARALSGAHQFRAEGSLEAWVWRICLNQAKNSRRERPTVPFDETDEPLPLPPFESDFELADALRALSPKRRLVVFLRHFAGLSYEEIAAATGMRPGTVAATLNKAHATLAAALEPQEVLR